MKDREIRVGDRVEVIKSCAEDSHIQAYAPVGLKGTVVYINSKRISKQIAVEFDESFKDAHDCNGRTKEKKGQWYRLNRDSYYIYWKDCLRIISKKKNNYY